MTTISKPDASPSVKERAAATGARSKKILVCVEDAEQSVLALGYVGALLRDAHDVSVTLFHVLRPMPRELMEHGGSENPADEVRLGAQLRREQEDWLRSEGAIEFPILLKALEQLGRTGFPLDRVALKFGHERGTAESIIDEVRSGQYGTIVVARHGTAGSRRLFGTGITERLLSELSGVALCVVG